MGWEVVFSPRSEDDLRKIVSYIAKDDRGAAVRFSTLEPVCSALTCQPGDILEFLPDTGEGKQATASEAESDRSSKGIAPN